jgi:hypothetical protein
MRRTVAALLAVTLVLAAGCASGDAVVGAPEVAEAGRVLEGFALEECGMDLDEIRRWGGSFGPPG